MSDINSALQRYAVCLSCNAKMFSAVDLDDCPRCGSALSDSEARLAPWSSHRGQREPTVSPRIDGGDGDGERLLRTVAFALRHDPRRFFLAIDPCGWVDLAHVVLALRYARREWTHLTVADVRRVMEAPGPARFEIVGDRIRALYGHSLREFDDSSPEEPPKFLFHGTTGACVDQIMEHGLRPMGRRFVHLTLDCRYARSVAEAKSACPVVLVVRALEAYLSGVRFRRAGDHVWLAEATPPQFLERLEK